MQTSFKPDLKTLFFDKLQMENDKILIYYEGMSLHLPLKMI